MISYYEPALVGRARATYDLYVSVRLGLSVAIAVRGHHNWDSVDVPIEIQHTLSRMVMAANL